MDREVSASTHNQALSALLFLYKEVLGRPLRELAGLSRPRGPSRLPIVRSTGEVRALLSHPNGVTRLLATLLYGSSR